MFAGAATLPISHPQTWGFESPRGFLFPLRKLLHSLPAGSVVEVALSGRGKDGEDSAIFRTVPGGSLPKSRAGARFHGLATGGRVPASAGV